MDGELIRGSETPITYKLKSTEMAINIYPANGLIHLGDVTNDHIIGIETPYGKSRIGRVSFESDNEYGILAGIDIALYALSDKSKSECLERLSLLPIFNFEKEVNVYFFDSERELVKWLFDIKGATEEEESIAHFESGETECVQAIPILDSQACSLADTGANRISKLSNKMTRLSRLYQAETTPGTVAYVMKKALKEKQYKRFLKEIKREQIIPDFISFMVDKRDMDASEILNIAFVWRESKQGYDYWANLYIRLRYK